ncbi:MAG: GPP34 family phosphoprotein [Pseudonocardiales bacterium]|nr:MAG: GPP34 family phosphoprotein [Pseudonocardiales bacterium]
MNVSLPEELLLVAYDDVTGRALSGEAELDCGLAGAVLVELALAGRIDVVNGKVAVLSSAPGGEPVIDSVLARIAAERKGHKPQWWVAKLRRGLRAGLLVRLTERGVLRMHRHRVLGIFAVRRYPALDGRLKSDARARLELAVVRGARPDIRTAALASLLNACGLARRTFPELGRRELKARMEGIDEGQWASTAVRKAIQSIHSAVAVVAVAASTTTATASSPAGNG